MKFKVQYKFAHKLRNYPFDDTGRVQEMIEQMTSELTDEEYHELCHQLYGLEPKFSEIDGECSYEHNKKYHTIAMALQYDVFWRVLEELSDIEQEKKIEEMETSIPRADNPL